MSDKPQAPRKVKNLKTYYKTWNLVGTGMTSNVYHAKRKNDDVAIKVAKRADCEFLDQAFTSESSILKNLDNEYILKWRDFVCDVKNGFCIELEPLLGLELYDVIYTQHYETKELFKDADIYGFGIQMLEAITYIHSKNIIHRDIKPENFRFREKDRSTLVLCDFGIAETIEDQERYSYDMPGTVVYSAPEIFNRRSMKGRLYKAAEMWSLGVTLFVTIYGGDFVESSDNEVIIKHIINSEPDFSLLEGVSPKIVNFVKKLLQKKGSKRPTAEKALEELKGIKEKLTPKMKKRSSRGTRANSK